MVETTTKNYGWTKPELQKSPSTWGGFLNNDLDSIDALVFANQQGIAPIGSGALWFTTVPPANWLLCDGSALDTTQYAGLFAVIKYTFGGSGSTFNLPNPFNRAIVGAGAGLPLNSQGGEATHTLTLAEAPAHAHNASQAAHTHPGSYQDGHNHAISDPGHAHNIYDPQHAHNASQDAHSHGGVTVPGATFSLGQAGYATQPGRTDTQQPAVHIAGASTGVQVYGSATGINATDVRQPAVHIDTQQPAVTMDVQGGGAAHNNWPPYIALNMIIRFQ